MVKDMREIRRKDRVLDGLRAKELLVEGEYGFLAMVNANGGGYGVPLSYAMAEGEEAIYFHCAPEGHKLINLDADNRVTFTVVGRTRVIPDQFTTAYECVMAFGRIERRLPETDRLRALRLLVAKYSAGFEEIAEKYIKGSFARTEILKLNVEHISAKAKKIPGF